MDRALIDLINTFEATRPGWGWLLRNDDAGGYFCNLTSPAFVSGIVWVADGEPHPMPTDGTSFPSWAGSAEEAFRASLYALEMSQ